MGESRPSESKNASIENPEDLRALIHILKNPEFIFIRTAIENQLRNGIKTKDIEIIRLRLNKILQNDVDGMRKFSPKIYTATFNALHYMTAHWPLNNTADDGSYLCPLTLDTVAEDKRIYTSTGYFYDKDALREAIAHYGYRNPLASPQLFNLKDRDYLWQELELFYERVNNDDQGVNDDPVVEGRNEGVNDDPVVEDRSEEFNRSASERFISWSKRGAIIGGLMGAAGIFFVANLIPLPSTGGMAGSELYLVEVLGTTLGGAFGGGVFGALAGMGASRYYNKRLANRIAPQEIELAENNLEEIIIDEQKSLVDEKQDSLNGLLLPNQALQERINNEPLFAPLEFESKINITSIIPPNNPESSPEGQPSTTPEKSRRQLFADATENRLKLFTNTNKQQKQDETPDNQHKNENLKK